MVESANPAWTRLEVRNLGVTLSGRPILDGFDLEVEPGERIALMGPSGSGKTTLLRALVGLIDASGEVKLDGVPIEGDAYPAFRRKVVWVSQRAVMPGGTVEEVLKRPFEFQGVDVRFSLERARELLQRLDLEQEILGSAAVQLSEGQRQRLALIRALLIEPRALLLDEPTSGLDRRNTERVEALLTEVSIERKLALLIVTHDRAFAERVCNRLIDLSPFLRGARSRQTSEACS